MRTKTEIIKEFNEAQALCDRLTMDIGRDYIHIHLKNDNSLVVIINQKIEALQNAEAQLRTLEEELSKTTG